MAHDNHSCNSDTNQELNPNKEGCQGSHPFTQESLLNQPNVISICNNEAAHYLTEGKHEKPCSDVNASDPGLQVMVAYSPEADKNPIVQKRT
eukprot:CAMPEP_0113950326 /NCGR_PEP_ID=MMETSP1339-20121228/80325_1 /TAXON_ID=94617 /ORGANISM="Fibrocapsa japonica" /LENGTH=91 /DNA_ID=CAMNT_0000958129 /DNA_START=54 /DNA_END=329 /DNA_ORIENTATION=+ /assembly_acc=CAM_ASM_000762